MPEFTSGVEYKTLSCLVYCPAAGGNHARNLNPRAASILTGCATRSSDIAAAYVSPIQYQASRPPDDVLEDRIDDAVDLDLVEPEGRFAVAARHPFERPAPAEMFRPSAVLDSGFQGLWNIKWAASETARAGANATWAIS